MIKSLKRLLLVIPILMAMATTSSLAAPHFDIHTTTITTSDTFTFAISAAGNFDIDCGTGGILNQNGAGVSGNSITRANATSTPDSYSCTYTRSGTKTVSIGGTATAYYNGQYVPAISFSGNTFVETVTEHIIDVFPSVGNGTGYANLPGFYETFSGCTNLVHLDEHLFEGYSGNRASMFEGTFKNCTHLTSIPPLFATVSESSPRLFYETFSGCTSLDKIPSDLFKNITSSASCLYQGTFKNCSNVAKIPSNLFDFKGNDVNGSTSLFMETFSGCSSLTAIPDDLFARVITSELQMFMGTFSGCTGLESIPGKLFYFGGHTVTGQGSLFRETFAGCNNAKLTEIPGGLFDYVTSAAGQMFMGTFQNCSNISIIPADLFSFYGNSVTGQGSLFYETFSGCSSLIEIPDKLFDRVVTGAGQMFMGTFQNCIYIREIPRDLFKLGGASNGQTSLFMNTFKGCTGLRELPNGLFSSITTTAIQMFAYTFYGCTGLNGYIPKDMFSSAIVPAPATIPNAMMTSTFYNTGDLATTSTGCPDGTVYYQTGYETNYWSNHIVCEPGSTVSYSCGTNGTGTAPGDVDVPQNTSFTPAAGTPCTGNNGYGTFTGWLISGTNEVKPAGTAFTWTYTGNKTLTAQYTPNTLALNWYNTVTTMSVNSASQSCTYDETLTVPSAPSAPTGFTFAGWEVRPTYNFSTIPNTNGVEFWAKAYEGGTKCWYATTGGSTEVDCASDPNFADLANPTSSNSQRYQWKVRFPDGILYGFTRCSETQETIGEAGTPSSTFGHNGWCMATGWKPNGATSPSSPTASLQWVMGYIPSDGTTSIMNARCKRNVARTCANRIRSNSSFRTALFTPAQ